MSGVLPWLPVLVGALAVVPLAFAAVDRRPAKVPDDRLGLLQHAAETAAVLVLVRQVTPWTPASVAAWYALVALGAIGYAGIAHRAAAAPWIARGRANRGCIVTSVLSTVAALALAAGLALA
ncbi:hypothetical protein [Cellulomonas hominis]|uniref:hypothetical protein n=1 Tax=Cellulomonas hominis TaxID=156981 RepID=UPI001443F33E|nr:hypothetical protein [Cellulomonas hominis]NKY11474.1 hypothetical protein [Cellulomonas hominis]